MRDGRQSSRAHSIDRERATASQKNFARADCWSKRGNVACSAHVPDPADPRYQSEGWAPLIGVHLRAHYQCLGCHGRGLRRLLQDRTEN
jgi:hypothetical protein